MLKRIAIALAGTFLYASSTFAIGWECDNTIGGHYWFDGTQNTVMYYGPLNLPDVLTGVKQNAYGFIYGVIPFVRWDMSFPALGYTYTCQNTTPQTANCSVISGMSAPLTMVNCQGRL